MLIFNICASSVFHFWKPVKTFYYCCYDQTNHFTNAKVYRKQCKWFLFFFWSLDLPTNAKYIMWKKYLHFYALRRSDVIRSVISVVGINWWFLPKFTSQNRAGFATNFNFSPLDHSFLVLFFFCISIQNIFMSFIWK